jgi:DNA repair protein RadD
VSVPFELREYQRDQLDALHEWWAKHDAIECPPLIVAPTGSGKSFTIALIVDRLFDTWPEAHPRTVVIVPSKELAEQNAEKLRDVLPPHIRVDYYSASLGRKNARADVVVATIGSIYKDAGLLGQIRCVVIDEAHLVNPNGDGKYRQFLDELRQFTQFAVVGLTATPFRGTGVWLTQGADPLFAGICHETKTPDLIEAGYLSPLSLPEGGVETRIDTSDVRVSSTGDYAIDELSAAVELSIPDVAREAVRLAADRHRVIAFTPQVKDASALAFALQDRGWTAEVVCGSTPKAERAFLIAEFRAGRVRCLVTVLALATGFDVPDIDCIIWARPTRSPVLYIQGAGRGLRIAPGKDDCLWLDFSDTTDRLGPIDEVQGREIRKKRDDDDAQAPFTTCPSCHAMVRPASALVCPLCGAQIREEKPNLSAASNSPVLSTHRPDTTREYCITSVTYHRHQKPGAPDSIRVEYYADTLLPVAKDWVCPQHGGWAASKAVAWLLHRAVDRQSVQTALLHEDCITPLLKIANAGGLRMPSSIRVDRAGKYPKITMHSFEDEDQAA